MVIFVIIFLSLVNVEYQEKVVIIYFVDVKVGFVNVQVDVIVSIGDFNVRCTKSVPVNTNRTRNCRANWINVPCGKCLNCRIKKRSEWTLRMIHELKYHDKASFITLTYDDDHMNSDYSLRKKDIQDFFKRFRKRLKSQKIRYFYSGEYGKLSLRPHYHAILFGHGLEFFDCQLIKDSWTFCDWKMLDDRKSFGYVTRDSIQYVASYIHDKLYDYERYYMYDQTNRENPFHECSKGLGRQYCDDNADELREKKYVTLNGVKYSLPRYYFNRLGLDTEDFAYEKYLRECDKVESVTGIHTTEHGLLSHNTIAQNNYSEYWNYIKTVQANDKQRARNTRVKLDLHNKSKI